MVTLKRVMLERFLNVKLLLGVSKQTTISTLRWVYFHYNEA